jgi:hypothetical protein
MSWIFEQMRQVDLTAARYLLSPILKLLLWGEFLYDYEFWLIFNLPIVRMVEFGKIVISQKQI